MKRDRLSGAPVGVALVRLQGLSYLEQLSFANPNSSPKSTIPNKKAGLWWRADSTSAHCPGWSIKLGYGS